MKASIVTVLCLLICLTTNVQAKSFIINGEDVPTNRPFYAYIEMFRLPGLTGGGYFGGGSLISQRAVLTVAHNVFGFESWRVGVGAVRIAELEWYNVESDHIHPEFDITNLANNIAVLRLTTMVPLTAATIPIGRIIQGSSFPTAGSSGYAVGFGFGATNIQPNVLQEVRLTVLSTEACAAAYPHLNQIGQLENHFCAQNATTGANICAGDQGGPIVSAELNLQFGVQSFNRDADCGALASQPGGFIRISQYGEFINQHA